MSDQRGQEFIILGPPGTGKTTTLTRNIRRAVDKHGDSIIVASFTKTAAQELVGRSLPVEKEKVATLHAHAYRSLGKPPLVETKEFIELWNKGNAYLPITIGGQTDPNDPDATLGGKQKGDEYLTKYQTLRAQLVPRHLWPHTVSSFASLWESFKHDVEAIDFTDMIERAVESTPVAPGSPAVGFFDEFQDFTALEMKLVRQWASNMEFAVYAGDEDQCLYQFKGASPEIFLDLGIPIENKRVLKKSYRVPRAVHAYAMDWIKRVSRREEKEYEPRNTITGYDSFDKPIYGDEIEQGFVRSLYGNNFERVHTAVMDGVEKHLSNNKTVMILTTCGYMLNPVKAQLKERGILFHNPYAVKRGDWNPIGKGVSRSALLSYLASSLRSERRWEARDIIQLQDLHPWSAEELKAWLDSVKTSGFMHNKKKCIETGATAVRELTKYFEEFSDLLRAINGDLEFFASHLASKDSTKFGYLIEIVKRRGAEQLTKLPQVTIGTIHSVKGGQADIVYVYPDVSLAGYNAWDYGRRGDVIRQFYVAFTRARFGLYVCGAASQMSVPLPEPK